MRGATREGQSLDQPPPPPALFQQTLNHCLQIHAKSDENGEYCYEAEAWHTRFTNTSERFAHEREFESNHRPIILQNLMKLNIFQTFPPPKKKNKN
jgi:hypothetical protein